MKNILFGVCMLLNLNFLSAQIQKLEWLDIELSN